MTAQPSDSQPTARRSKISRMAIVRIAGVVTLVVCLTAVIAWMGLGAFNVRVENVLTRLFS